MLVYKRIWLNYLYITMKHLYRAVLVHLTVMSILSFVQLVSGTTRYVLYEKMDHKRFQNVLRTLENKSTIACCEACQLKGGCDLVSYNKQSRTCELHEFGAGHEVYIRAATGWDIFYSTADDCASKPCQNSGVCNDGIGHYTCTCTSGYQGTNCEISLCPGGRVLGNTCYFIVPELFPKAAAEFRCASYGSGGRLANVKTADIHNLINTLFREKYNIQGRDELWLGAYAIIGNDYYWSDGTAVGGGFTAWNSGEPNLLYENCVIYQPWAGWNDVTCTSWAWGVCERQL